MKFQSNAIFNGTITANSVADAGTNTGKFLVLNASGVVTYRTAAELYADLNIGALPAGYTSTIKHEVKAGVAINKGQAVYVSSSDGTNMIVSKASNAAESTSSKTMGLLETTLAINGKGNVVTEGLLAGLDTTGATNPGDPVWLGTNGDLIYGLANKPSAPAHLVFIGIVTRINANNGEIFVKVQNGFEMGELHNYAESGVANNDVIVWESATSLYKPKSIPTILGYTPVPTTRTLTINGTAYDLSADRAWTITTDASARSILRYIATAGQTTFTISGGYTPGLVDAYLNGVKLDNTTDFTATNGTTIVLTNAAAVNDVLEVYRYQTAFVANNALRVITEFTATAGQTTFSVTYNSGLVDIFYNGSKLSSAEYTAGNGTSIILNFACNLNDIIEVHAYSYQVGAFTGQAQLNGTGFVKVSGTTVSYDNSTYLTSINSSMVTTALGYTPYNATNPSGYITSSALSSYLPLTGGTLTGALNGTSITLSGGITTSAYSYLYGLRISGNDTGNTIYAGNASMGITAESGNTIFIGSSNLSTGFRVYTSSGAATFSNNVTLDTATNPTLRLNGAAGGSPTIRLDQNGVYKGWIYLTSGGILQINNNATDGSGIAVTGNNVLIGTTTDNGGKLQVGQYTALSQVASPTYMTLDNSYTNSSTQTASTLKFYLLKGDVNMGMGVGNIGDLNTWSDGLYRIYTGGSERMRITSGGNVEMYGNTLVKAASLTVGNNAAAGVTNITLQNNQNGYQFGINSACTLFQFLNGAPTVVATINGGSGAYTALSDVNKKKDFEISNIGLNEILQLKPTLFRFKDAEKYSQKELGFIAQEVKNIIPQAYTESGEGDDKFIGLQDRPIIAALVKAIQEQQEIINQLSAKVTELENR